jgi:hypothetical protein
MRTAGQACIAAISGRAIVTYFLRLVLLLATTSWGSAQLTTANPKHLDLPEPRARVLLIETCRVVANEFHVRNSSDLEYSLTLVLGEKDEGYGIDNQGKVTFYLQQWSERKFVDAATRLAVQSLANRERVERLVKEILRRSDRILPVPQNALRSPDGFPRPSPPTGAGGSCISAVRDEPCPTTHVGGRRQWEPGAADLDLTDRKMPE